jgi:23S rRNA pseudouridine2605 synthase
LPLERLQKILARRGYGSRRKAEALIRAGRVRVDGAPAEIGQQADAATATITVDGVALAAEDPSTTLMLHKPPDVVVSASDDRGRRTVFDLLDDPPSALRHVGRLDRDSEGLLVLTTDGELAHRLAHPRYEVAKVYEALVERRPGEDALARLRAGIELDDGPTRPAEAELMEHDDEAGTWVRLVLHEGRKRQVRRMLAAVGHPVRRLVRTRLGTVELGELPPGASRPLDAAELAALRALVGLDAVAVDAAEPPSLSSRDPRARCAPEEHAIPTDPTDPTARPGSTAPTESIARSVAIDGPTASGKSVVGRALARRLGYGFLDTGLMYRACTLAVLEAGVDPEDPEAVAELVRSLDLDVRWDDPAMPRVVLAGADVGDRLREPEIEAAVSLISRVPAVRSELVRRQRAFAARSPIVMSGRDIGTRVLTEARTKLFLDASLAVRAARRLAEQREAGRVSDLDRVSSETERRDRLDATGKRAIRPEQAAPDAIVIDTDALGVEEVVARAVEAYGQADSA